MPLILLDPAVSVGVRALAFLLPLLVHTAVGNLIEPKVFGSSMELHPAIVLLALAFWGALWGISGAILSVPLTATCRIALSAMRNPWSETLLRLLEGRNRAQR
jgi:AI-2 transport protein TqsA